MDFAFKPSFAVGCEPESPLVVGHCRQVIELINEFENVFELVLGGAILSCFAPRFFILHLFITPISCFRQQSFFVQKEVLVNAAKCLHCTKRVLTVNECSSLLIAAELDEHDCVAGQPSDVFL